MKNNLVGARNSNLQNYLHGLGVINLSLKSPKSAGLSLKEYSVI